MQNKFSSISPIDGSVVWSGRAATQSQIESVMQRADEAGPSWRSTPVQERADVVRRYGQYLRDHQAVIAELISREVGKLSWDAAAEVGASIGKVAKSIAAMEQRRAERVIAEGQLRQVIRFHPLGVTLVLGPFNFPLHLPGAQIIPALLAGNTVVFKPSDQATAVGQWMIGAWRLAGLPDDVLQMITGGVATAVAAIDSPAVSGVFLTGSRDAGRAIHRQLAGRPDVLLALELGGNNPIVVTDVNRESAASLISFSAFISSGQRCTCARRAIFVEGPQTQHQMDALIARTNSIRVGMPEDRPVPHLGPLISAAAVDRLEQTYETLLQLGCQRLIPMLRDTETETLVRPAIVDATPLDDAQRRQMSELEWFGPLLVVQRTPDFDSAIRLASNTPYGLAASLLGGDRSMFEQLVDRVGAGVVNWNRPTTGAAGDLPFGGLGDSGNHRPAGFYAIDFCSDPVASLEAETMPEDDPWIVAK